MVKIFFNLFFVVLTLGGNDVRGASTKCEKTVTTASLNGLKKSSSEKKVCSGDLIFEETFDSFDLDVWDHCSTLNGDRGVCLIAKFQESRKNTCGEFFTFSGEGISMVHKQSEQLVR